MDQIPETLLDYLVMNACRRVVEDRYVADPTAEITRDLIARVLTKNVIDNTSLGVGDTEGSIRLAVDELVARALPNDNDGGEYQRRTLASYLDIVRLASLTDTTLDGTPLGSVWWRYYNPFRAPGSPDAASTPEHPAQCAGTNYTHDASDRTVDNQVTVATETHGYWWGCGRDVGEILLHLNAINDSVPLTDLLEVRSRRAAEDLGVPAVLLDAYEAASGEYAEYGNPKDTYISSGGVVNTDLVAMIAASKGVEVDDALVKEVCGSADGTPSFAKWLDHTDLISHDETPSDAEVKKWIG